MRGGRPLLEKIGFSDIIGGVGERKLFTQKTFRGGYLWA